MHVMDAAWSRALRDPSLHDLPYKIETNEYGQLVMSPTKLRHREFQSRIAVLLADLVPMPGSGIVEYAIETSKGVKVPDVVWLSAERSARIPEDAEASHVAPEICIEVLSESNTKAEIVEKRRLYFNKGALETWTCDLKGDVRFYGPEGERNHSELVPAFPGRTLRFITHLIFAPPDYRPHISIPRSPTSTASDREKTAPDALLERARHPDEAD
jgi:Uma2 family endonuclease